MSKLIHISQTDLSDYHKEAYGFRPRGIYKTYWTEVELQAEYAFLSRVCEANMIEEREAEETALIIFDKLVSDTIKYGAGDEETATRWLIQGEDLDIEWKQDVENFFWRQGLSWEKINEFTKKVLTN